MKFAKELEEELVPEWKAKYLNYKVGKKKIKAISRALRNVSRTPKQDGKPRPPVGGSTPPSDWLTFTHYDFTQRRSRPRTDDSANRLFGDNREFLGQPARPDAPRRESMTMFSRSPPVLLPISDSGTPESPETQPLNGRNEGRDNAAGLGRSYGSIIGSPPLESSARRSRIPVLELPDPAMSPTRARPPPSPISEGVSPRTTVLRLDEPADAYHIGPAQPPNKFSSSLPRHVFSSRRTRPTISGQKTFPQSKLRRMFSAAGLHSPGISDLQMDTYRELDARQNEFFDFLDKELEKIESFYKEKEREANDRLQVLREQLHELRDRRIEDIEAAKSGQHVREQGMLDGLLPITPLPTTPLKPHVLPNGLGTSLLKPIENVVLGKSRIGKTTKAMETLSSPPGPVPKTAEDRKDYVRRHKPNGHVPYRFAKRRLKLALQEFYRGLELLKSYVLLNRTGFRKINKKYDKAVNARPTSRYMAEKVNNSYFVQSNVIENHLVAVEDLYARYFERGNHKIAVGKLRTKLKSGDQSTPSFRNGLFVSAGILFAIQGLIAGAQHLNSSDPILSIQSSYLLQIYAGYFLALFLFLLFVIDCKIWTAARINYIFVFEYDTRHVLDWRQLAELPCFFLFLNGFILWLNFRQDGADAMYLYWPVVLIGLTLVIMCLPLPILYHRARKWWGFSNWRLLLAGLYPVEFRDFYLGDMFCSQTYAMSQIEIYFCLYAHSWNNPAQCNSNHSRLLGFFTTLPAIWRSLQCLRRYYDSRNWFPHLANFVKYLCNILYYMSLSLYRIHKTPNYRAGFTVVALVNGLYCSFWDVAMDFSLGNPYAQHPFLRDQLGYRRVWVYYAAAILDVVIRQQWIFFVLYTHDLQHSAIMSFFISLAEVFRRGMWSLFRVENEHCNNVGKFRASRDIELPYSLPHGEEGVEQHPTPVDKGKDVPAQQQASTGVDLEAVTSAGPGPPSLRRRKSRIAPGFSPGIRALQRVGTVIASAHAQDFQKKKRVEVVGDSPPIPGIRQHDESSEDEEEEEQDEYEEAFGAVTGGGTEETREDPTLVNRQ